MTQRRLRRILLVEDDPALRMVARVALEKVGGFQVLGCASGPEALAQLAEFGPDLALLDVMMPEMDGPATLRAIRGLPGGATLPVAYLTAKVHERELGELRAQGVIGVLAKPFDPMRLSAAVNELWLGIDGEEARDR